MNNVEAEDLIKRTARETASEIRENMRDDMKEMLIERLGMLGFNMDPNHLHEEQQFIAGMRALHQTGKFGFRAIVGAIATTIVGLIAGWATWFFTGHRSQ